LVNVPDAPCYILYKEKSDSVRWIKSLYKDKFDIEKRILNIKVESNKELKHKIVEIA
jgi:hypothetical protein